MHVDKAIITYGRMRLIVSFDPGEQRYTDPQLAARMIAAEPLLPQHSCINTKGPTFGSVIRNTSIAHLLEHMIIAKQTAMASERGIEDATFVGNTHWIDESRGLAEVQVSFIDDLDAANALSQSLDLISGQMQESHTGGL